MTMPNVYMEWCKKQAECPECKQLILVATPSVVVFYWNKGNEEKRSYNVKRHYHPQCWISMGLDYLMTHPYYAGEQRGPKVELSKEDRRKRQLLLRKYAVYQSRKRRIMHLPIEERVFTEIRLDGLIASIIMETALVGGIPKRWIQTLIQV